MQLTIAVVNSLYAFQLSKLTQLIANNQAKLKIEKSSDKQFELLEEQVTSYRFFNLVVTGYHIKDWIENNKSII